MEDRQAVYEYKKHLVYEEGRKNSYENNASWNGNILQEK